jgi:phosphoesterase RecJ-like protein
MEKSNIVSKADDATWASIYSLISSARAPTIITHTRPDADAYGSSLGLYHILKSAGISATVVDENPTHRKYSFFPGSDAVVQEIPLSTDLLLVLDCADERRVGDSLKAAVAEFPNKVCIDHHLSNAGFGDPCIVDASASSTSEIIFGFAQYLEMKLQRPLISADAAVCLFAGVYGDTGGFRYSSTGIRSFEMGAELVKRGVRPAAVVEQYLGSRGWSQVKIQSEALLEASTLCGGKVVEIVVPQTLVAKYGGDWVDTEGLVEQARDIDGVQVGVFIGEDGPVTKVSLRSRAEAIAVNTIAEEFGGGGHKNAAAFRSKLSLVEVQTILRKRLEELLCPKV